MAVEKYQKIDYNFFRSKGQKVCKLEKIFDLLTRKNEMSGLRMFLRIFW